MKLSKQAPKRKDSGPRQYPEEGVWGATLFKIVILGRHAPRGPDTFNKGVQKLIRFTFEMPEQLMKDENGAEDVTKPFIASVDVPFYEFLADRAKMTMYIKAIAGDKEEIDLKDLLGKPADIHITVTEDSKGGKWTNIKAVTPMKAKDKKDWPAPINPVCYFNFYEPDIEGWDGLYDWEKRNIGSAVDFKASKLEAILQESGKLDEILPYRSKKDITEEVTNSETDSEEDDENPF